MQVQKKNPQKKQKTIKCVYFSLATYLIRQNIELRIEEQIRILLPFLKKNNLTKILAPFHNK